MVIERDTYIGRVNEQVHILFSILDPYVGRTWLSDGNHENGVAIQYHCRVNNRLALRALDDQFTFGTVFSQGDVAIDSAGQLGTG
ncbi:hypothetical protein GCM10027592_26360 [Spirosoma flavus]